MARLRVRTVRIGVVALAITAAVAGSFAIPTGGHADTSRPRPPDWTAEDWAALTPSDQALEWTDYPAGASDPTAKAQWTSSHPDTTYDAALDAEANSDGPGFDLTTGVSDISASPFPRGRYVFQNEWQDLDSAGTTLIQVWAGLDESDPCAGVLVVNRIPFPVASGWPIGAVTVEPGAGTGPIVIAGADGHTLSLRTQGGDRGEYNVDTGRLRWSNVGQMPPDELTCSSWDRVIG